MFSKHVNRGTDNRNIRLQNVFTVEAIRRFLILYYYYSNSSTEIVVLKTPCSSHSSEVQNYALMHREGLNGYFEQYLYIFKVSLYINNSGVFLIHLKQIFLQK